MHGMLARVGQLAPSADESSQAAQSVLVNAARSQSPTSLRGLADARALSQEPDALQPHSLASQGSRPWAHRTSNGGIDLPRLLISRHLSSACCLRPCCSRSSQGTGRSTMTVTS